MSAEKIKLNKTFFASNDKQIAVKDSVMKFESAGYSYKGVKFNIGTRFFSKSTVGNITVFSLFGNIYLAKGGDTSLLVKFEGHFDPKFGSGYLAPKVDPTGNYVLFVYAPGAFHFFESQSVKKMDLKSRKMTTFRNGSLSGMTFSNDGNFLLFSRNEREAANETWISDIYILDLLNKEEYKIGKAYSANWSK